MVKFYKENPESLVARITFNIKESDKNYIFSWCRANRTNVAELLRAFIQDHRNKETGRDVDPLVDRRFKASRRS
jgi:hypothetical protein